MLKPQSYSSCLAFALGINPEMVTELQAWRKIKETVKKMKQEHITAKKIADKHITVGAVITQYSHDHFQSVSWTWYLTYETQSL